MQMDGTDGGREEGGTQAACPARGQTNSFEHLEVCNKQHRKQAQDPSGHLRSWPGCMSKSGHWGRIEGPEIPHPLGLREGAGDNGDRPPGGPRK